MHSGDGYEESILYTRLGIRRSAVSSTAASGPELRLETDLKHSDLEQPLFLFSYLFITRDAAKTHTSKHTKLLPTTTVH